MVKPTLMQQLLKQPSQSYTNNPTSIFDDAASSKSKKKRSSASVRSSASIRSGVSSHYSDAMSDIAFNEPPPPMTQQQAWEWSQFGARKGLTGGPGSIRAQSVLGVPRDADSQSIKSSKSMRSMRSYASVNSFASGYQSLPPGQQAANFGNGHAWTHGVPSSSTKHGTSRRYSSMQPATGYAQPDYSNRRWSAMDLSSMASSPAMSREPSFSDVASIDSATKVKKKKKKKVVAPAQDDVASEETPSLSSSISTHATSPPDTPPSSVSASTTSANTTLEKPKKKKKKTVLAQVILEGDEETGWRVAGLESVAEENEDAAPARAVPSWIPNKTPQSPQPTQPAPHKTVKPLEQRLPPKPVVPVQILPDAIAEEEEHEPPSKVVVDEEQVKLAPSQLNASAPAVGRKYTMDEFFASLPLSIQGPVSLSTASDSTPGKPSADATSEARTSANASSASSFDESERTTSSSRETEITRLDSPVAEHDAQKAVSSDVPRIKLTRTESDQAALGLKGPVDISAEDKERPEPAKHAPVVVTGVPVIVEGSQSQIIVEEGVRAEPSKAGKAPKSPEKKSKAAPAPEPTYNVIASSKSKSSGLSSSQDSPSKWSKGVRSLALDPTAQPLILEAPKRSKSQRSLPPTKIEHAVSLRSLSSSPSLSRQARPESSLKETEALSRSVSPPASVSGSVRAVSPSSVQAMSLEAGQTGNRCSSSEGQQRPSMDAVAEEIVVPRAPSPSRSVAADQQQATPYGLTAFNLQRAGLSMSTGRPKRATMSLFSEPQARISTMRSSYGGPTSSLKPPSVSGMSVLSAPTAAYQRRGGTRRGTSSVAGYSYSGPTPANVTISNIRAARSTMSALSISATASAAGARGGSRGFSLFKRQKAVAAADAPLIRFEAGRDLTFGELQPTPTKMRSDEVLVQVFAVGVDHFDWQKVKALARDPAGFGFIPGRSFYGKAVQCGSDVRRFKKGDFVYGLNELRKSGAMAEYMTVQRDLLTLAPAGEISIPEIAALPHAGTWAMQVMTALCEELERGSKILILNAHEGVGNMCMRLARHFRPAREDLWLVAQVPRDVRDGEAFCLASGACDVFVDDPLATFNCIHESSFDVVIDTVGGRRIYDASRRILHFTGSFVTTVGDSFDPNAHSQWKTSIRSLRRSFFKKDKKSISYWCVNLDAREYPRESLDKLREIVEKDPNVRPVVNAVLDFENSKNAFGDGMGSSTVVQIVGPAPPEPAPAPAPAPVAPAPVVEPVLTVLPATSAEPSTIPESLPLETQPAVVVPAAA